MNTMITRRTAIMVDGGFYRKRAAMLWGKTLSAEERADELFEYCLLHLSESEEPRDLYRIFYYDCPPMTRDMIHPLTKEKITYAEKAGTRWSIAFHEELAKKRKLALRMGELAESQAEYVLKPHVLKKLISKEKSIDDLRSEDFKLSVKQKGVDMRIGLDVASLAQEHLVDQIILIAGDSDFIPVAKMARRNGIDFILDPMGQYIKQKLSEHLDGLETYTSIMHSKDHTDDSDAESKSE